MLPEKILRLFLEGDTGPRWRDSQRPQLYSLIRNWCLIDLAPQTLTGPAWREAWAKTKQWQSN